VDALADKLVALGGRTRLRIVLLLNESRGEVAVKDIAAAFGIAVSAVSQHLSKLKALGLVTFTRDDQSRFYRLTDDPATAAVLALAGVAA